MADLVTDPRCSFCGSPKLESVVDLGRMPLANRYLTEEELASPEPDYPLHARYCRACHLVQVEPVTSREEIFEEYAYFSSFSTSWLEHSRAFAEWAVSEFELGPGRQVLEVASNDGYLLSYFRGMGVPVLGVEPAANVAKHATAKGIATLVRFFGADTAGEIRETSGPAALVVANNVFAHVPDLNDFSAGLKRVLAEEGVVSIEVPHLLQLIERTAFDTIYHEHYSYFSLLAIECILREHGLEVFDVQELPTHGGSLRVLAGHVEQSRPAGRGLAKVRADEDRAGLASPKAYSDFARRVQEVADSFRRYLEDALSQGRSIAAYGAAAKGNTFLNYVKVGDTEISMVADLSPHKQGRYLPGTHLPIVSPEELVSFAPDDVVILPWNIREEIRSQLRGQLSSRFIVAIPELDIAV